MTLETSVLQQKIKNIMMKKNAAKRTKGIIRYSTIKPLVHEEQSFSKNSLATKTHYALPIYMQEQLEGSKKVLSLTQKF